MANTTPQTQEVLDGLSQLWANLQNPNAQPGEPSGPPSPVDRPLTGRPAPAIPGAPLPTGPSPVPPAPIRMGPGGVNLDPPAPRAPLMIPGLNIPGNPAGPPAIPPPTDDPTIAASRQRFQDTSNRFGDLLKQSQDANAKIAAVPQVNRADYKPSIGRKMLGMVLGGLASAGGDEKFGAETGRNFIDKPYNRAVEQRSKTLAPFLDQQNAIERERPLLNAANESAWREYSAGMGEKKEARQEARDAQKAEHEDTLDEIKKNIGEGRLKEEDQRRLDRIDRESDNLDIKKRVADIQDRIATMRENKQDAATDPNGWSPSEAREINQRQRPLTGSISGLEHARGLLIAEGEKEGVARIDAELGPLHQKLTDIENEVTGRRKSNQPAGGGGKPAAGGPPASLWKGKENKVLNLKDSKGNTQKWVLKDGVPQQYNQGGK